MSRKKGFAGLLAGLGIGLGIGFLLAPKEGSETRKDLKRKADDLIEKLKSLDYDEVKDNLVDKIKKLETELEDLDKEKALDLAKKKAEAKGEYFNIDIGIYLIESINKPSKIKAKLDIYSVI